MLQAPFGVVLGHLLDGRGVAPPLFAEERRLLRLARAMDRINGQFGPDAVYFAGMHRETTIPTRIAFTNVPDV